jgi:hypothetical protein
MWLRAETSPAPRVLLASIDPPEEGGIPPDALRTSRRSDARSPSDYERSSTPAEASTAVDVGRWAKGRHVTEVYDELGLQRLRLVCPGHQWAYELGTGWEAVREQCQPVYDVVLDGDMVFVDTASRRVTSNKARWRSPPERAQDAHRTSDRAPFPARQMLDWSGGAALARGDTVAAGDSPVASG